ncbi:MAG TPA: hypothetical protein ENH91_03990 [Leeuwenhoekiella sp.]|nr:hypothetical protein [Leeuwenhoekiella sp.]
MRVLIPAKKDENPFFDQVMLHSKHTFVFGGLKEDISSYTAVVIHWPEQLFNWQEPTDQELDSLKTTFKKWKQQVNLLYVVHNLHPHQRPTLQFKKLYDIVEGMANVMVHFGQYSRDFFRTRFPDCEHRVIPHPLYLDFYKTYDKTIARRQLHIPEVAAVLIAPGSIRSTAERNMILQAFKRLNQPNKLLLVPKMLRIQKEVLNFPGRYRLKRIFDINKWIRQFKERREKKKGLYFNYKYLSPDDLALYMCAADVVLLPRLELLNAGTLFLALTYKKIVAGPKTGNLSEVLKQLGMPGFDPQFPNSAADALQEAFTLFRENNKIDEERLITYQPENVARKWDILIENSVKNGFSIH